MKIFILAPFIVSLFCAVTVASEFEISSARIFDAAKQAQNRSEELLRYDFVDGGNNDAFKRAFMSRDWEEIKEQFYGSMTKLESLTTAEQRSLAEVAIAYFLSESNPELIASCAIRGLSITKVIDDIYVQASPLAVNEEELFAFMRVLDKMSRTLNQIEEHMIADPELWWSHE